MRPTPFLNSFLNSGLPGHGYTVAVITTEECDVRRVALLEARDAMCQEFASLFIVASEGEQTVRLITRPGHFAHPSILERRLVWTVDGNGIAVSVMTCADQDLATRWITQFKVQDLIVRKALAT